GRYFMEHPYADVAEFDVTADMVPLMSRFGHYWQDDHGARQVYLSGMSLSARVQKERGLLNCSMYLMPVNDDSAAIQAARRLAASRRDGPGVGNVKDVRILLGRPLELAQAAKRRALEGLPPVVPPMELTLGANAEQLPDRNSRIMLSDQVDALGVPLSKIDWRMHDLELETIQVMLGLVSDELRRLGLPVPKPAPWLTGDSGWRKNFVDTAHHTGATRMADDPKHGVTDPWGRVHTVDGLYVAGSSTFPTVGTANPTLMIVAQAMRVADTVRERQAGRTVPAVPKDRAHRQRVAFVGSGDRVKTTYMPIMRALADRFEPVGFTSRSADRRVAFAEETKVGAYDSVEELLTEASPDLLVIAAGPQATLAVTESVLGRGVPLLIETPWAWSTRQQRSQFEKLRRDTIVGVAEPAPFLPEERLRLKMLEAGVLGALVAVYNESASFDQGGIAQVRRYVGP
ncbi:MAG: GMC oxidoreductase, partial [Acidimicrobiales bacterium]